MGEKIGTTVELTPGQGKAWDEIGRKLEELRRHQVTPPMRGSGYDMERIDALLAIPDWWLGTGIHLSITEMRLRWFAWVRVAQEYGWDALVEPAKPKRAVDADIECADE